MANIAKDIAQIINRSNDNKPAPYDTQATVGRIEGNTVWVQIPGGEDETPIEKTVNCTEGDKVQVRVSGGRAWITGNASAPPTDDTTAIKADTTATKAQTMASDAKETAEAVEGIAEAAQASAATASAAAAQAVLDAGAASSAATAAQNSANSAQSSADNASEYAARALGNLSTVQSVAETLTWITAHGTMTLTTDVTPDPTHVYFVVDAGGDYTVNGVTYAIVTEPVTADMGTYYELSIDESLNNYVGTHLALDTEGLWLLPASSGTNKVLIATGAGSTYTVAGTYLVDSGGSTVASFRQDGATMSSGGTQIAHFGYGPGTDSGGGTSNAPYYTLGERYLYGSIGNYSVAEGHDTTASGFVAHAEGSSTEASGNYSHAEGSGTYATGRASHAEGSFSVASGLRSHAQGYWTIARRCAQTTLGEFNDPDQAGSADTRGDYVLIIGNGTANDARSNALTVDWSGNVVAAGDIEDGSGNVLSNKADTSSLATVATSGEYSDLLNTPTIPTFLMEEVSIADNISIPSTGTVWADGTKSVSKTGYTPIGVVGFRVVNASSSGSGGGHGVVSHAYLSGTGNTTAN